MKNIINYVAFILGVIVVFLTFSTNPMAFNIYNLTFMLTMIFNILKKKVNFYSFLVIGYFSIVLILMITK